MFYFIAINIVVIDIVATIIICKMYKQPTNALKFYDVFLFIIFLPTCLGQ